MSMSNYFFDEQLAKYIVQFMAIFEGLSYVTGKREDGEVHLLPVPVVYGSRDRVSASILASNTQNDVIKLPTMSAYVYGIELAPERRKGVGVMRRKTFLPKGGLLPDDITAVRQIMPIPYNLQMELSVYTSNMNQHRQICEQIMMYFDPLIQIQKTDENFDWTKITQVELVNINFDENYPAGIDKRAIVSTFNFLVPIYISAPSDLKTEWVKDIYARIIAVDTGESIDNIIESLDGFTDPYELIASVPDDFESVQIGEKCEDEGDSAPSVDPDANC